MSRTEEIWIIIPAYNEATVLPGVLSELTENYQIVIVDDGSTDNIEEVCRPFHLHFLRHEINLGQGAALQTGMTYALERGARILVSFDADGQMDGGNIPSLVEPLARGEVDVVLGTRFGSDGPDNVPFSRRLVLKAARSLTNLMTGLALTDTHNGFRAFTRAAAEKITIEQNRMAHASEIIHKIAHQKLRYREVPVQIRYTDYSRAKGQSSLNSLNILWDLFFKKR